MLQEVQREIKALKYAHISFQHQPSNIYFGVSLSFEHTFAQVYLSQLTAHILYCLFDLLQS